MEFTQRQEQRCSLCGQPMSEHLERCPFRVSAEFGIERFNINCPDCEYPRGKIDRNRDDFFECRKCNTQYSAGLVGSENQKIIYLIDNCSDEYHTVYKMNEKGSGDFPVDHSRAIASRAISIAKSIVKQRKKKLTDFTEVWIKAGQMVLTLPPKQSNVEALNKMTEILRLAGEEEVYD